MMVPSRGDKTDRGQLGRPRIHQKMAGLVGILSLPTRFARPAKTKIPVNGIHNGAGLVR